MFKEKTIVNVQFKSSLSQERLQEISNQDLGKMANVNGLIYKYYYTNTETKIIGGTYIFENVRLAREYLKSFFVNGIGLKYGIIPDTLKMEVGIITLEVKGKNSKYQSENHNLE